MTMCSQAPICSTSEEGNALIRISKENKGYTIDLFKGFLTWKRESLTRNEHAFLEQLAEEGQEEDLNRAMKVLCNNEIIFPIQNDTLQNPAVIRKNDSSIIARRSIHTLDGIESGERDDNAPSLTCSSSPEGETVTDGVELIDSEHGIVILQDVVSNTAYDHTALSSRRAQDGDNSFKTERINTPDDERNDTPPNSNNRNGSSMGSQLRQNRVVERKGSFIHLNMWKAHRQGLSLTPSSSVNRSISKSRQPSPFNVHFALNSRNGTPSKLETESLQNEPLKFSQQYRHEESMRTTENTNTFKKAIDDDDKIDNNLNLSRLSSEDWPINTFQSERKANPLTQLEVATRTSMSSKSAKKPSLHRRRSSDGSMRDPSRMRPLRQSSPLRPSVHHSSVSQRIPSPIPGYTTSEFLDMIAVQNDMNLDRYNSGSEPFAFGSTMLDDNLLDNKEADAVTNKAIDPPDAQLRDLSALRQCLSATEYDAPRANQIPAINTDKQYFDDSKLKYYDAWDILEQERENLLPFKILGTSADDEASMPHVLSPPLMETLYDFLPFSCSESNFFMKYSLIRDGASFIPMLQQIRGSKHTILAIETTDGEVFGAFTSTAWKHSADYYGSGESFLWRMKHDRRALCTSVFDQANLESEVDFFPWTGSNYLVQYCSKERLALGGGDSRKVSNGGFAVAIESTMLYGTSMQSGTFDNPPLSKVHTNGTPFEIVNMEIWSMTPANTETEAERLEMATLFLEEHM
jgi:hypothetical protein